MGSRQGSDGGSPRTRPHPRAARRVIVRRQPVSAAPPPTRATASAKPDPRRYVPALLAAMVLIALTVGSLPFVVGSMIDELGGRRDEVYDLNTGRPVDPGAAIEPVSGNVLSVAVIDLDEAAGKLVLAVSGNRNCVGECPAGHLTFLALDDASDRRGITPFVRLRLAAGETVFSEQVELPIRGTPTRYPFDTYHIRLGVGAPPPGKEGAGEMPVSIAVATPVATPLGPERTAPGETSMAGLAGADAREPDLAPGLTATLQNQLVQFAMAPPEVVEAHPAPGADAFDIRRVHDLTFRRPTYLPVLTVLLVVLVAASSTMSLFTQAIDSLLLGVGGLILAVWGVRSVLSPQLLPLVTAVDLALLSVILFLLLGLAIRVALHLRRRAEVDLLPPPPWEWRR